MVVQNNERDFGRLFEKMEHMEQKTLEMSDLIKSMVAKQTAEATRINRLESKIEVIEPEVKEFTRWRTFWTGYAFALMSIGAAAGGIFATLGSKVITWFTGT